MTEFETDARCAICGERLVGVRWKGDAYSLRCACGTKLTRTTREWIEQEFCKPYNSEPSEAPTVNV